MVAHPIIPHLQRRQNTVSDVPGLTDSATTAPSVTLTATSLHFVSTAVVSSVPAPPLAGSLTPVITLSSISTASSESTQTSVAASSSSSAPLSLSTVIASCVGAFIGAIALIFLGLWFYRRYTQSLKTFAKSRQPLSSAQRNARGDEERRRSRLEPWNKLEDGNDKWEGMYQTKEPKDIDAATVAPMEKLTMFKKTPSTRTAWTHKSDEHPPFELPHPFVDYHSNLPKELDTEDLPTAVPRPFLGRSEAVTSEISWDGETVGQNSFLSMHSTRLESGAMSPTLNMAIPTPQAIRSEPHRWESAEVIHYDEAQTAEVVNPTTKSNNPFSASQDSPERKKTSNNPFFNARDFNAERRRSRSDSQEKSPVAKGKERHISLDPFSDDNSLPKPPQFVHHVTTQSSSSVSSNDRAIQSLIAALDVTEEEIQDRLRVASMQPSVISASSAYTEDENLSKEFPLPPSSQRSHQ